MPIVDITSTAEAPVPASTYRGRKAELFPTIPALVKNYDDETGEWVRVGLSPEDDAAKYKADWRLLVIEQIEGFSVQVIVDEDNIMYGRLVPKRTYGGRPPADA